MASSMVQRNLSMNGPSTKSCGFNFSTQNSRIIATEPKNHLGSIREISQVLWLWWLCATGLLGDEIAPCLMVTIFSPKASHLKVCWFVFTSIHIARHPSILTGYYQSWAITYNNGLNIAQNQIKLVHLTLGAQEHDEIRATPASSHSTRMCLMKLFHTLGVIVIIKNWSPLWETHIPYRPILFGTRTSAAARLGVIYLGWCTVHRPDRPIRANLHNFLHEVNLCRPIYGQASQVVFWLGVGWDGSNIVMEFLQRLGDNGALHLHHSLTPGIAVNGLALNSPDVPNTSYASSVRHGGRGHGQFKNLFLPGTSCFRAASV
jgi:hypothetical protein